MQVLINGEARETPDQLALSDLVIHLSLAPERVAIELNQRVVRRADWGQTILAEGDRIEIVHFVGGGAESFSIFHLTFLMFHRLGGRTSSTGNAL